MRKCGRGEVKLFQEVDSATCGKFSEWIENGEERAKSTCRRRITEDRTLKLHLAYADGSQGPNPTLIRNIHF